METFVILDLETTGLDPTADQIIEIAALKVAYDGGTYREIGRFQTLVALEEGRALPPFITELTGITAQMLDGAAHVLHALKSLEWFVGDTTVVAHNAPFDLEFLRCSILPYLDCDVISFICTRAMAKLLGYEKASLKDVYRDLLGEEIVGHHRAMTDVEACYHVFKALSYECETHFPPIDYRNIVVDSPDRPLRFVPRGAKVVRVGCEEEAVSA